MLPGPPYTADRTPPVATIIDPAFKEATIQQMILEVQQQFKSYVFSLAYAGAKGTHLAVTQSNNQSRLASPANPVNGLTPTRPPMRSNESLFSGLLRLRSVSRAVETPTITLCKQPSTSD